MWHTVARWPMTEALHRAQAIAGANPLTLSRLDDHLLLQCRQRQCIQLLGFGPRAGSEGGRPGIFRLARRKRSAAGSGEGEAECTRDAGAACLTYKIAEPLPPRWTIKQVELLLTMWPDHSAQEIADALGTTRGAVLGKIWRVGLGARKSKNSTSAPGHSRRRALSPPQGSVRSA